MSRYKSLQVSVAAESLDFGVSELFLSFMFLVKVILNAVLWYIDNGD